MAYDPICLIDRLVVFPLYYHRSEDVGLDSFSAPDCRSYTSPAMNCVTACVSSWAMISRLLTKLPGLMTPRRRPKRELPSPSPSPKIICFASQSQRALDRGPSLNVMLKYSCFSISGFTEHME